MTTEVDATDDRYPKRARVKEWLSTEWSLSDLYDPNTTWIVQATNKVPSADGQSFVVVQTPIFPDQILIQASAEVVPEMQERLMAMPAAERREFLWESSFRTTEAGR
jgi:hypothetical protein